MRWLAALLVWVLAGPVLAGPVLAQDGLSALARLDAGASSVRDAGAGLELRLAISQPVPWRVRVLDQPPRLVLDFREVDWRNHAAISRSASQVKDMRAGLLTPGWSRLVLELAAPLPVVTAEMQTGDAGATVVVRLGAADPARFAEAAARPEPALWALPKPADLPKPQPPGAGPLVVVLDPGHGGIDPGAERDGKTEADLMLTFARELKEQLARDSRFLPVLTREEDVFVPLETRLSIARAAGGHVFLSLHADALAEGEAVGATVYTLADEASDEASATLAERHDRADLLAGVDLTEQDDLVAVVLMDMARTETRPRIDALASALETAITGAGLTMHRHPRQEAGFSVLKSPDIPSVLLELGFLSSERDLTRLTDPAWRAKMADAVLSGLDAWAAQDQARRSLGP